MLTITDKGGRGVNEMLAKLTKGGGEGGPANADNHQQGG